MASNASEKRKRLILATLGGLLVVVVIYQFIAGPAPRPSRSSNANSSAAANSSAPQNSSSQKPKPQPSGSEQEQAIDIQLANLTPLDLGAARTANTSAALSERGDIFAYYVPPPTPPTPPPPPPPIGLQSVQPPGAVAGTPRDITLTITGTKIPADAQVFLDNSPRETKRVNESQVTFTLKASEYASPRSINIDVKSQSDPMHNNSNPIQFTAQPLPEPAIRYIGRLGENGVFEMTVTKEIKRLHRGELIQGVWRIDSISDTGVDITNTQYEIKRRIPMQEKTK